MLVLIPFKNIQTTYVQVQAVCSGKSWTLISVEGTNWHGVFAEIIQVRAFSWKNMLVRATDR